MSVYGSPPARRRTIAVAAVLLLSAACGRGSEKPATSAPASQAPSIPPEGTRPAATAPAAAKPPPIVAPVDPELLKSVLPEISGWTRGTPRAASLTAPAPFSKAEARYERLPAIVHVEVQDTALNQVLLSGMAMFLAENYEERSADGHKKAGKYQGHPGFEEWKRDTRRGEINVLVARRFVVSAIGQRLENMNELVEVVNALDLSKLVK